jgi:hypothetical protein
MTTEKRKHRLLLVAGLSLMLLAGDRLMLTPLVRTWKVRSARITEYRQSINRGELLLERRETLQERWLAASQAVLPADGAQAENRILDAVNDWSGVARIEITSFKPHWVDDDELGPRLEIQLSGSGDLKAISRFLYPIETDSLPFRMERVELHSSDDRGRGLTIEIRCSGLSALEKEGRS